MNIPLDRGDNVWSPEGGTAEIQILNGSCVRIDSNTSLSVVTLDKDIYQFSLDQGNTYVNSQGPGNDLLQLDTPSASVRVFGKAVFEVDVSTEGLTDVSVLSGRVSVENQSGSVTVSAGQIISTGSEGTAHLSPLPPPDDWTRWNQDRDRIIYQHRNSARYLPNDLWLYSYDLDQNGPWVSTPDYGYVWTPTVVVAAAWSPYSVGRWVWRAGDYLWISYGLRPCGICPKCNHLLRPRRWLWNLLRV
jgi:hypothetical protein